MLKDDVKSLSILLHFVLVNKLNFTLTNAANFIADIVGKSDRTIRAWRTSYLADNGSFPDTLQGKYQRSGVLWQNEELNRKAVRENASVKGKPNMNLRSFTSWVNECLLPFQSLEPGYPRQVSIETARKWLHHLGFSIICPKKGTYVDGHERDDVVQYRNQFLRKMVALGFLNKDNAPTQECVDSLPGDLNCPDIGKNSSSVS